MKFYKSILQIISSLTDLKELSDDKIVKKKPVIHNLRFTLQLWLFHYKDC